jgi:hypothetical protein
LCKPFYIKAVKEGWACIAHHYVATGGGEERGEYYLLSPEIKDAIADFIPGRLPKEVKQKIDEIKENMFALKFLYQYNPDTYGGLGKYSQVEENILSYLKELKGTIDSSKDLFTSGFSSQMPYMIRDADAYKPKILKFEKELDRQISDLFSTVDKSSKKKEKKEEKIPKPTKDPTSEQDIQEVPFASKDLESKNKPCDEAVPLNENNVIYLGTSSNKNITISLNYDVGKGPFERYIACLGSAGKGKTGLARIFVEESIRNGIPVIALDVQGDIVRLLKNRDNLPEFETKLLDDFKSKVDARLYTPLSKIGSPISINPLVIPSKNPPSEDLDDYGEDCKILLESIATSLVKVCISGKKVDQHMKNLLTHILTRCWERGYESLSIEDLINYVKNPPDDICADPICLLKKQKEKN